MSLEELQVRLRELEPRDLPRLNSWRNDRELVDLLGNNFLFIAGSVDERWYQGYLNARDSSVRLAIEVGDPGDYAGNVNLTTIHAINRSAEFSILIGERKYWGKGIGERATRLMLAHAFTNLNLHRVFLKVLRSNERARRLYQRVGFVEEGCEREAVFKSGTYHDLALMSMLASEFRHA